MSLLLEALKRAEKAKQKSTLPKLVDAQEPASQGEKPLPFSSAADSQDSPFLFSQPGAIIEPRNVATPNESLLTPQELPGSSEDQPDLQETTEADYLYGINNQPEKPGSVNTVKVRREYDNLQGSIPSKPETSRSTSSLGESSSVISEQQRATRQFFAAKAPVSYSNKILAACLGLFFLIAVGGVYYYWQMLNRHPSSVAVTTPPILPGPVKPVIAKIEPPIHSSTVTLTNETRTAEIPEEDELVVKPKINPITRTSPAIPVTKQMPLVTATPTPAAVDNNIKISRSNNQNVVPPALSSAYQAFVAGNTAGAQNDYRKVLQSDPRNRDALLGLAAIAVNQNRPESAETIYLRMLELDPKDAMAQAGLISVNGQMDPIQAESRLKTLLAQQPNAAFLNFTLGNLYVNQSRWAEAQQAFFHAYSRESDDPDYAYNLAVSLDHLNQQKAAVDYYQRALSLAEKRSAIFDKKQLMARIRELTR